MGNLITSLLFEIIVVCAIVYGLTITIQRTIFKNFDATYKKAVKPVILWCLFFVVLSFDIAVMGYNSFGALFSYIDKQMSGAQALFGNLGAIIAANQAANDLTNYMHNNPVASDYGERALMVLWIGAITTIVTLIFAILTIKSIAEHNRFKESKIKAYFLVSAGLISFLIGIFITLIKASNDVNSYKYEFDDLMPIYWLLGSALTFGLIYFYYKTKYNIILDKVYDIKPVIAQPDNRNTIMTSGSSYGDKPTKSCPYCGETILAIATKCKHCGEWLPKEEAKKYVQCQVCGEDVEEGLEVCPFCNEKVDGSSVKNEPKTITCPICAEQIPADADICPICNEKIK